MTRLQSPGCFTMYWTEREAEIWNKRDLAVPALAGAFTDFHNAVEARTLAAFEVIPRRDAEQSTLTKGLGLDQNGDCLLRGSRLEAQANQYEHR